MNDIKLSDQIQRKFIDTIDIDDWEVETDTGWAEVESVSKTIQYRVFEIKTETGKVFRCADDHILFDENFDEIFAKDTLNKKIVTKQGFEKVIKINELDCSENMYDLQINSSEHRFWTSEILSHNSTSIASYMLHYVLFNPNKFCAILANKADSAREILGRIQLAYELLPFWLKQGVIDWNKGSFSLENGSKIIAAATSSSAIRGRSCIVGSEMVTVRDKETGKIKKVSIEDLSNEIKSNSSRNIKSINNNEELFFYTGDIKDELDSLRNNK